MPLIARNLLDSIKLLAAAARLLDTKCVSGIEPNEEMLERHAESTLQTATGAHPAHRLRPHHRDRQGGPATRGARCARWRASTGVDEAMLDQVLDHRRLARPHD